MNRQRFESEMDLWKPVRSYAELLKLRGHYYRLYTQQFRHQLEVAYGVVEEESEKEEVISLRPDAQRVKGESVAAD